MKHIKWVTMFFVILLITILLNQDRFTYTLLPIASLVLIYILWHTPSSEYGPHSTKGTGDDD